MVITATHVRQVFVAFFISPFVKRCRSTNFIGAVPDYTKQDKYD